MIGPRFLVLQLPSSFKQQNEIQKGSWGRFETKNDTVLHNCSILYIANGWFMEPPISTIQHYLGGHLCGVVHAGPSVQGHACIKRGKGKGGGLNARLPGCEMQGEVGRAVRLREGDQVAHARDRKPPLRLGDEKEGAQHLTAIKIVERR